MADGYAELQARVAAAGLLRRSPAYYGWRTLVSFAVLFFGCVLAWTSPALAPIVIAVGCVQVALIGHDAGHMEVFADRDANNWLGRVCWTAGLGISFGYWTARHNQHHANPNHVVRDPDLQWSFGPLLTPFLAFTFRVEGWHFALRSRRWEVPLLIANAVAWSAPLLFLGPGWLLIFLLSQVLASLYLAAVVAPNHIGMPTWPAGTSLSFLERQLRSSRNVRPGAVTDFVFGGLDYQIEHHLFPSMPRNHFSAARAIVKPFCAENALPYSEASAVSVYRTILNELPRVGRVELA